MINLTEEQANTVFQLLDVAVKAGGLQNAKIALPIAEVIMAQLQNAAKADQEE